MAALAADLNLQAWHTVACRWASCLQPVGRRCITGGGVRTSPHAVRLDDLGVWLGRQPEVDALQHTVEARDATIAADRDALRRVTTERDGLKADLAAANLELTQQGEQVLTLTRDLAVTKAELAAYVKTHPDVPPVPGTRYGMNDCCYFNAVGTTGDHRLIPGQAYSDPTIAELRRRITA